MNFKPTLTKTIVSILIGATGGLAFGWQRIIIPTDVVWTFYAGPFVMFSLVILLITYLIWSLIQKKK